MSIRKPIVASLLALTFTALMVVTRPLAAADEAEPTYSIVVKGGSVNNSKKIKPWQRLLAFDTRLHELLQVPEGEDLQTADVGCELCPQLALTFDEKTGKGIPKPGVERLTELVYIAFAKDKERLSPLFREALVTVKGDQLLDDVNFIVTESSVDLEARDCGGKPSPCNPRAVCTMYNGCSRSAYSCKKCY